MRPRIRETLQDAVFLRKFHGWMTLFWAANFPPVILCYIFLPDVWKAASILYLALVSIYANVAGEWAAWQAARIEVKQDIQSGELPPEE